MRVEALIKRRKYNLIFFFIFLVSTLFSITVTDFDITKGFTCIPRAIVWSIKNFYPCIDTLAKIPKILVKLKETFLLSIASTTVAAVLATFFALCGSQTTRINGFLSVLSRGIATIFRNIPVVAWAMILLFSFGQGDMTGYFALFFGNLGFLTRAFAETIDEASDESVEALKAVGASYFQIIFKAVIPSSLPQMVSWILFMIETNIRSATLVGILTGTGIGFLFNLYYKSFQYNAASMVVVFIVITVLGIEFISNFVRRVIL